MFSKIEFPVLLNPRSLKYAPELVDYCSDDLPLCISEAMAELIDQILHDRYRIQSLLGQRAGRRTLLATDLQTESWVVVKLALFGPDFTWDDLKLFEREAEVLKCLDHPAIPKYLDSFGVELEIGKGFALVQSYIEAASLQSRVQAGYTFNEGELKELAKALLEILSYIHNRQPPVIHRDIKPSNILLGDRSGNSIGRVYLVDFGSVQTAAHGGTMTIVGTYGYMPPEQFGGRAVPASDLYSVGATLIWLATGQHPADLPQKDLQIEFEQFVSLSPSFIRWIRWLTEPSLSRRPESAEIALEADFYQNHRPAISQTGSSPTGTRFSLELQRSPSRIQLEKSTRALELKVPEQQLSYSPGKKIFFSQGDMGCLAILAVLIAVFYLGLEALILPGFFISCLIYYLVKNWFFLNKTVSYRVLFEQEGHSIMVSLILIKSDDSEGSEIVSRERVVFLSAGPHLPKYQLNVSCEFSGETFNVKGNRREIQWLCDELQEWSGCEIRYHDSTPTA